MTSLGTMVRRLDGLRGTKDISDWEHQFIESIVDQTQGGALTVLLSDKQAEIVERIFQKHFAG
jgi:dynactin complex subunit